MQTDGISRHLIVIVLILSLFTTFLLTPFSPSITRADTPPTFYVGPDETYTTIQAALNDATDGYRIIVYAGTYQETLYINNSIDLFGEDRSNTIIDGDNTHTVITINAGFTNISHFTITGSSSATDAGLIHINQDNCIITDNLLTQGHHAIILDQSDHHLIYDNTITDNTGDGIRLIQSHSNINISFNTLTDNQNGIFLYNSGSNHLYHNTITENNANGIFLNHSCTSNNLAYNTITKNTYAGIFINDYSDWTIISHNTLDNNTHSGLVLENCSFSTITTNQITSNINHGIMLIGSINTIEDNIITHNTKDGIYLNADDNTLIQINTIAHNTQTGIRLYNSTTGIIRTNTIHHNLQYGIYLDFFVINTTIYNNYLHHNTQNAIDKSINRNHWNQTPSINTNVIGGNITAGNYWDDFDELDEGITDTDNNGICDTSYTIYNLNRDYAPLLDTIPPTIQTITINPTSQTEGSSTNIQTIITDNTEIKEVHLAITTPTGTIRNLTITQNKTGNTYSCNTEFSPVGTFNFSVHTKDPLNWQQSTQRTFHILEGSPPTITDNSPTTGSPSHSFTFNTSIKDDIDPASDLNVTVQWQHGTKQLNTTLEHRGNNYFTETIHLDSSLKPLTYTITAADHWGNSRTTTPKTITITDTEPPIITIHQYTPTLEDPPNTFTFTVSIIDNTQVNKVYMDYWYQGSPRYTVDMDTAGNGRYTKTIVPTTPQERIYCIIYANDTSDNLITTMNPNALPGGPYYGFVKTDLLLNATNSFDLDGNITHYTWNFGDGTTANGSTTTHQYLSSGTYTIQLTVTDDDENTHTQTTTATIGYFTTLEPSLSTKNYIQNRYNISLPHTFYCFDSDGDTIMDSFVDPNGILIHLNQFTVSTNKGPGFALSIDEMYIPEFLWFIETDEIQSIDYETGIVDNIIVDETTDHAIVYITVDKKDWLYLEVTDQYPDATLTITTQNRTIPESMIWRTNNRIYLLDDATTSYIYDYLGIIPPLTHPEFNPSEGSVIDANHSTITITYTVPVNINSATFGITNILNELETGDNQIFFYTPPGYLADDTYTLTISATSIQGNKELTSNVVYFYFAYTEPPPPTIFELYGDYMIMAFIAAASIGLVLVINIKQITLDGFIYFKNKRILPFFKTIVLGPVSVHVDNEQISKAEFYVDGQLKHVLTEPPYLWHWNEHAVLKHTLETKVYDAAGNNVSSGEMEMYVFNVYRNTKF